MKPAYGYIFENENLKIAFTGDTSLCRNVEYMTSSCNYLFFDCIFKNSNNKYIGIDNIKYLSEKYFNYTFVVTHLEE